MSIEESVGLIQSSSRSGGVESFLGLALHLLLSMLHNAWIAQFFQECSESGFPWRPPYVLSTATSEWELGWQAANGTPCRWHPPTRS